jgi:hypothetical protein
MSRRTALVGLGASLLVLLLTIGLIANVSLPGPHVRSWLGIENPPLPDLCEVKPNQVLNPPGSPAPGRWRLEHDSPIPSPEEGATTIGRYVYIVGGQERSGTVATVLRFDPLTGEYRSEPDAPVAIDHPVVANHGGDVILASGFVNGSDPTNRAWEYTPRSRKWSELPPMRVKRGAAAGAVVGDRLYVAGGTTAFGNVNDPIRSLEIYDFKEKRWHRGPDMPTPRHHFGVGVVGGKLYFAGGRQPVNEALNAFEEFDPSTNRWYLLSPVPVGTGAPGVTAIDGRVVVTGGGDDPLRPDEPGGWVLRSAYAYRPGTRSWMRLPDMRRARHGHAAAAADGRVYVFRGAPCPGYGEMASVESLRLR